MKVRCHDKRCTCLIVREMGKFCGPNDRYCVCQEDKAASDKTRLARRNNIEDAHKEGIQPKEIEG